MFLVHFCSSRFINRRSCTHRAKEQPAIVVRYRYVDGFQFEIIWKNFVRFLSQDDVTSPGKQQIISQTFATMIFRNAKFATNSLALDFYSLF